MTSAPEDEDDAPAPILTRSAVWAALIVIAVIVAFGTAIDGGLVWDDTTMVGAAAALRSPWAAFSRDFFALGARAGEGAGASYFRPLVTLSFALDVRLFSAAPQFGLHLGNLIWHAIASVLVGTTLLRWTRASSAQARIACWLAALFWAVVPAKAENVAWISGRGDVMGLALLLAGLALRRRLAGSAARAAVIGAATAVALLCKESFVVAPVLAAIELACERDDEDRRARVLRVLRAPETLVSTFVVVAYLAVRRAYLPIHGGGEAMFAGLSIADRVTLVIETLGHVAQSLVLCFEAHLLRGPIGFRGPFRLQRDESGMAMVGTVFVIALATAAWRLPRLRPAALLFAAALLPVVNVVPSGLESRFSDRFLYVPSLGIALGMATVVASLPAGTFRALALGLATGSVGLMLLSSQRSMNFRSSRTLWEHERRHGQRAPTVLHNAAMAALRERRFQDARDRLIETADRYGALGFAESYPYEVAAVEAQVRATGEADRASFDAYRKLLEALASGQPGIVHLPLASGRSIHLPTETPSAKLYATQHAREIRMALLVLDARRGDEQASAAARGEVEACPRCRNVLREAARVDLALAHPDLAMGWLARLGPDEDAERDGLAESAEVQAAVLRSPSEIAKARALFLGEAYAPACEQGVAAIAEGESPRARTTVALACKLAGNGAAWEKARRGLDPEVERDIASFGNGYRTDPAQRIELFKPRAPR